MMLKLNNYSASALTYYILLNSPKKLCCWHGSQGFGWGGCSLIMVSRIMSEWNWSLLLRFNIRSRNETQYYPVLKKITCQFLFWNVCHLCSLNYGRKVISFIMLTGAFLQCGLFVIFEVVFNFSYILL